MRTRKRLWVLAGLVLAAALFFSTQVSVHSQVQSYSTVEFAQAHPGSAFLSQIEALQGSGQWFPSVIQEKRWRTLWGREHVALALPYARCDLRSVGTAGTADWQITTGVLTASGPDVRTAAPCPVDLKEPSLCVLADGNTSLFVYGTDVHSGNRFQPDLTKALLQDGAVTFPMGAATLDSSVSPDQPCLLSLTWEGDFSLRAGLFLPFGGEFSLSEKAAYLNNVT